MATQNDVRRIALALPDVFEEDGRFAFSVTTPKKPKAIAWVWQERVDPKRARVPNPAVVAIRVASDGEKHELIAADPEKFFTEPHYNGFPAVLVRLKAIRVPELRELLTDAWRVQAPKTLVRQYDTEH